MVHSEVYLNKYVVSIAPFSTPACPDYHISYQKFIVRPLLREPGPWVHYKSQPNAKTPRKKTEINKC